MSTQYQLRPRGVVFNDLFDAAHKLSEEGKIEESERRFRQLLTYADLGDYHKAGCHLALGLGSDNYLWHCEQAVDLYTNLYVVRPGNSFTGKYPPTEKQLDFQRKFVALANEQLVAAQTDHARIREDFERQFAEFRAAYNREPTDEELMTADYEAHYAENANIQHEAFDAAYDAYLAADPPEDQTEEHDSDDNEGLPVVPPAISSESQHDS